MKPIMTEKAVMMMETQNTLTFVFPMISTKEEMKKELSEIFNIKIQSLRTLIKNNKKYAYVKLKGETLAIDVATKLGLI